MLLLKSWSEIHRAHSIQCSLSCDLLVAVWAVHSPNTRYTREYILGRDFVGLLWPPSDYLVPALAAVWGEAPPSGPGSPFGRMTAGWLVSSVAWPHQGDAWLVATPETSWSAALIGSGAVLACRSPCNKRSACSEAKMLLVTLCAITAEEILCIGNSYSGRKSKSWLQETRKLLIKFGPNLTLFTGQIID